MADNGAGLGGPHQTGWTGIVADLIRRRPDRDALAPPGPGARRSGGDG